MKNLTTTSTNYNLTTKSVNTRFFNKLAIRAFILFLSTGSLFSCKKSEPTQQLPTAQSLNNLFDANLNSIKQTATFDAATTFTFTSAQGTQITIDGSCLRKNGNPVTGNVQLEFAEIFDRGQMAMTNKPTIGINASGEEEVLESGGEFLIKVLQDGVELTTTCSYNLETPTSNTNGTQTGMQGFNGTIDANKNITWTVATNYEVFSLVNPDRYASLMQGFGWFNYDRFTTDTRPKTTITALVPTEYANAHRIMLATKSIPNSLGGLLGKYPVGLECHVIFITEDNGNFRYAIKSITLVNNQQVTFSISETTLATAAQFKAAINALP